VLRHESSVHGRLFRPYSICRSWIQIHSESGFGFTGKSNGTDSWVLSEVTSLLFVYVCDTDVTSGFASESTSKLARFKFEHLMDRFNESKKSESGFRFVKSNTALNYHNDAEASLKVTGIHKHWNTHTNTQPFYGLFSGTTRVSRCQKRNFWTLWCKWRLTEADTPNIQLGATPSGLTSAHLHHPPFFTGWMRFLPPNQQCQSTKIVVINWKFITT